MPHRKIVRDHRDCEVHHGIVGVPVKMSLSLSHSGFGLGRRGEIVCRVIAKMTNRPVGLAVDERADLIFLA